MPPGIEVVSVNWGSFIDAGLTRSEYAVVMQQNALP